MIESEKTKLPKHKGQSKMIWRKSGEDIKGYG